MAIRSVELGPSGCRLLPRHQRIARQHEPEAPRRVVGPAAPPPLPGLLDRHDRRFRPRLGDGVQDVHGRSGRVPDARDRIVHTPRDAGQRGDVVHLSTPRMLPLPLLRQAGEPPAPHPPPADPPHRNLCEPVGSPVALCVKCSGIIASPSSLPRRSPPPSPRTDNVGDSWPPASSSSSGPRPRSRTSTRASRSHRSARSLGISEVPRLIHKIAGYTYEFYLIHSICLVGTTRALRGHPVIAVASGVLLAAMASVLLQKLARYTWASTVRWLRAHILIAGEYAPARRP